MKAILLDEAKKWLEENCENQYTRMAVLGIMQSMPTVDYQETPNVPLTLEQLRKMDGEPVLYKRTNQWFIVQLNHPDFGDCIITQSGYFLPLETEAERGLYAYHPAHIDLEAWEPCESCISCDNCRNQKDYDPYEGTYGECGQCYGYANFDPCNFCHECGKPLTPEARTMLEKRLRGCME